MIEILLHEFREWQLAWDNYTLFRNHEKPLERVEFIKHLEKKYPNVS